jgi:RNA polymerase sigma-70 factor (ECF subfamily)
MDRSLVKRARGGDRDAFSALVVASMGRLRRVARLILHDDDQAEDAVQDALVNAWRDLRGLRDPDRFEAWLNRLLVNACYSQARRLRRRSVREIQALPVVGPASPDSQAAVALSDQLQRGLRRLPVEQSAHLVLAYYLDLPDTEVAAILRIPTNTARTRRHRALAALRAELDAVDRDTPRATERFA